MRSAECGVRSAARNILAVALAAALFSGCASKELVITQAEYINTAMSPSGEPLELAIVYVYPEDLKHPADGALAPDSGITADRWFRDRPLPGDTKDMSGRGSRFWLPEDQILLLNNPPVDTTYGTHVGNRPRGAAYDKSEVVLRRNLAVKGRGKNPSVIFVFAKYIDSRGQVMPKRPAKFHPVGDYGNELRVRIGGEELEISGRK